MSKIQTVRLNAYTMTGGYLVRGTVVFGDWEGDPNVVKGIRVLPPYAVDVTAQPEGSSASYNADEFSKDIIERFEESLVEEASDLMNAMESWEY